MSRRAGYYLIVLVGILHRSLLYIQIKPAFDHLISLNQGWISWHFLSPDVLSSQLGLALRYLQQKPPIPDLLFGTILKFSQWPYETAHVLVLLQFLISLASSLCMYSILSRIGVPFVVGCLLSLGFLLSGDIMLIELSAFGRLFYETLAMLLVLICVQLYLRYLASSRHATRYSFTLGVAVSLLALTRASFSYFFAVPLVFILLENRHRERLRNHVVAYLLPVILLHGGWALKNYLIYGYFSPSTSSWQGANFQKGLWAQGSGPELQASILDHERDHPAWFVELSQKPGVAFWFPRLYPSQFPEDIRKRDQAISAQFSSPQINNSIALQVLSREYMKAYVIYAIHHPYVVARNFWRSYLLFWTPIRDYSRQIPSLIYVDKTVGQRFNLVRVADFIFSGAELGNYFVLAARHSLLRSAIEQTKRIPIRLISIPFLSLTMLLVNFIVVHVALVIAAVGILRSRVGGKQWSPPIAWSFVLACYCYLAIVCNLAEYGENNRFRVAVEPLLWIFSAYSLTIAYRYVSDWLASRRAIGAPADG